MKRWLIFFLGLSIVWGFAACGAPPPTSPTNGQDDVGSSSIETKLIKYEDAPQEVQRYIDSHKEREGLEIIHSGEKTFALLFAGMKNSAGYHVMIDKIEIHDSHVQVTYYVKEPEEGQFVAEVITYPLAIIEINKKVDVSVKHKK